ncbi:hypothetical protein BDZ85DRAFT_256175 [Elsinoe ampelina]|uniref:Uncharacterized protein n=1 Tax=Elsinoe ampelina TaxID=302913 RepID=A0A6A6GM54_9PEZI|nr:hypothetical protein BDZ85DRAFT_256175 [Elsinoe ampelina]
MSAGREVSHMKEDSIDSSLKIPRTLDQQLIGPRTLVQHHQDSDRHLECENKPQANIPNGNAVLEMPSGGCFQPKTEDTIQASASQDESQVAKGPNALPKPRRKPKRISAQKEKGTERRQGAKQCKGKRKKQTKTTAIEGEGFSVEGGGSDLVDPQQELVEDESGKDEEDLDNFEKFLAKHDFWRERGIRRIQRLERCSVDRTDPRSFEAFLIGDANKCRWEGRDLFKDPNENGTYTECKLRTIKALLRIVERRRAQAKVHDQMMDGQSFAGCHLGTLLRWSAEELTAMIIACMPANTTGVLGRTTLGEADMVDMATFTTEDLSGWIIYFGMVIQPDSTVECYIGAGTDAKGSGRRVIEGYEKSLRKARSNIWSSVFSSSHFLMRAALPGAKVHLRPLISVPIPPTEDRAMEARAFVNLVEGLLVDYLQTLNMDIVRRAKPEDEGEGAWLNSPIIGETSSDLAPTHLEKTWIGLNRAHPLYQSSKSPHARRHDITDLLLRTARQYGTSLCQVCLVVDMRTVKTRQPDVLHPPKWLPKLICSPCGQWLRTRNHAALRDIATLAELQSSRKTTMELGAHHVHIVKHENLLATAGSHCPWCNARFATLQDGESDGMAMLRLRPSRSHWTIMKAIPKQSREFWPWLSDIPAVCFSCYSILSNISYAKDKPGRVAKQLHARDLQNCATPREALRCQIAWQRLKGKRASRIEFIHIDDAGFVQPGPSAGPIVYDPCDTGNDLYHRDPGKRMTTRQVAEFLGTKAQRTGAAQYSATCIAGIVCEGGGSVKYQTRH